MLMRNNIESRLLCGLGLLLLMGTTPAFAQSGLLPPDVVYQGRTLDEWFVLHAKWSLATELGDPSGLSDTLDGVRFLFHPHVGPDLEVDVTLPAGTAIAMLNWAVNGERYSDGSQDNPADQIIADIRDDAAFQTILDGNVVLQGQVADHLNRYTEPSFFDQPVAYNQPQPRGPVDAVAGIWTFGVGGLYTLPVGQHTLENIVQFSILGPAPHMTYHITVVPEPTSLMIFSTAVLAGICSYRKRFHVFHARLAVQGSF
jgi:hypothetical protein